jgi:N-acetyl-1-D-myo-inositol-2-amino-2-deoxy-alpha-D-glucopyranoside deacetylase
MSASRWLVVVHAHPDDETLWTGGTIARYVAAGVAVTVVTCTLGEQGEVLTDELRGLAADAADQLGGYRVAELRAACAVLGVADQRFLGGIGRWRACPGAGLCDHAGVAPPADPAEEPLVGDAEHGTSRVQLGHSVAAELVGSTGGQAAQLVDDHLALLTECAGHHGYGDPSRDVPRDRPASRQRLIVRMRVHHH